MLLGVSGSALPAPQQSLNGLTFLRSPAQITVHVQRDGLTVADSGFQPSYKVIREPNGPGCEPAECRSARVSLFF